MKKSSEIAIGWYAIADYMTATIGCASQQMVSRITHGIEGA